MLLTPAELLVSRLPVYRTLLGLVAVTDSLWGVSLSDPYLSAAHPLPAVTSPTSLAELARRHQSGALVLGRCPFASREGAEARQQRALAALLREPGLAGSGLLACAYVPRRLSAAAVAQLVQDNLLWDGTGAEQLGGGGLDAEAGASVHAAVALQLFLDEHSGGWANTFG